MHLRSFSNNKKKKVLTMKVISNWQEKLKFVAEGSGHQVVMDTNPPLGSNQGMSPKQLVLSAVCGCTGMDVSSLLKKFHQPLQTLLIEAKAEQTKEHPTIFKEINLIFRVTGELDPEKVLESVHLSQTKYCGVSAMLAKAVPINYQVELNGKLIGTGQAQFH